MSFIEIQQLFVLIFRRDENLFLKQCLSYFLQNTYRNHRMQILKLLTIRYFGMS